MIEFILLSIIILFFIDYYHDQYNINRNKKNLSYRNSNSFYDDTDYNKYKPYRKIYTYKILIVFLLIILIIEIISDKSNLIKLINYIFYRN